MWKSSDSGFRPIATILTVWKSSDSGFRLIAAILTVWKSSDSGFRLIATILTVWKSSDSGFRQIATILTVWESSDSGFKIFCFLFIHLYIIYFMLMLDARVTKISALSVIAHFTHFEAVYLMMMVIV